MSDTSPPTIAASESPTDAAVSSRKTKRKSARRRVPNAIIHIQSTYNNTMLTASDSNGNVIAWSSAGRLGYSGAKKATPYAAQEVVRDLVKRLEPFQVKEIAIEVKGIGSARESAIRALAAQGGITMTSIRDTTPMAHNGCRPPRRRRV